MVERSKLKYFSKVDQLEYHVCRKIRNLIIQGKLKWDEDSSGGRHVRRKVTKNDQQLKNVIFTDHSLNLKLW